MKILVGSLYISISAFIAFTNANFRFMMLMAIFGQIVGLIAIFSALDEEGTKIEIN